MILTSIWAYAITIGVLVVFHEFGHYWVARLCGVKVLRFSVGFGKVLYARRFGKGETEWAFSAIPLGGYVKMLDEREGEVPAHELSRAFNRRPVWQRMAVVVAGPAFNLLLAVILYFILFAHGLTGLKPELGDVPPGTPAAQAQFQPRETVLSINGEAMQSWEEVRWRLLNLALRHGQVEIGGRTADGVLHQHMLDMSGIEPADLGGEFMPKLGLQLNLPPLPPIIGDLLPGDPGERAGLKPGDRVLSADGIKINSFDQWKDVVSARPEQPVSMVIERAGKQLTLTVTPKKFTENGKVIGRVGASNQRPGPDFLDAMSVGVHYSLFGALEQAVQRTWDIGSLSIEMLARMVLGQVSVKNLSGPVYTAKVAGITAELGLTAFVFFLAAISVGVGVLNLLPIPILDGGHLLYYMAEFLTGRPMPESAWETGQKIGAVVLIGLMILVFYNDISRLLAGG